MSLINDALKKAQRQREGSGTDPVASQVPLSPGVSGPSSPVGKNNFALIIVGGVVIVALSVAATVYFLRNGRSPDPVPAVASASVNQPTPTKSSPVIEVPITNPPLVSPAATSVSAATPEPSNRAATTDPAIPSSTTTPQTVSPPVPSSLPGPSVAIGSPESTSRVLSPEANQLKATNRIQGLIDKFKISGIRLADADSKVLLNDHLFRINDLVEPSLGLRLSKIESHELTFIDADGNSYIKHF